MKSATRFRNLKKLFLIDLLPAYILIAAFVVISCERDETLAVPKGACITTNMSYATDIKAAFESCVGCHSASKVTAGVKLDAYADAMAAESDNHKLSTSIKPGGTMRKYFGADTCSPNKVLAWIDQGMKP
jgi:cytochrome c551/c552